MSVSRVFFRIWVIFALCYWAYVLFAISTNNIADLWNYPDLSAFVLCPPILLLAIGKGFVWAFDRTA